MSDDMKILVVFVSLGILIGWYFRALVTADLEDGLSVSMNKFRIAAAALDLTRAELDELVRRYADKS